jgi:hypothetical protein
VPLAARNGRAVNSAAKTEANVSTRHLIVATFLAAAALLFTTGCADFKTYLKDRGNDLADCFTFRVSMCEGLGVRAQVTNYLTASVGGAKEGVIMGLFGRAPVIGSGMWFGMGIFDIRIHNFATDDRLYTGRKGLMPQAMSVFGINAVEFKPGRPEYRIEPPTPFIREKFFIEVGAALGAVGFDLGFNPAEFVDFLLGWTTLDITGDDAKADAAPEPPPLE